jgi:hypothetical protein
LSILENVVAEKRIELRGKKITFKLEVVSYAHLLGTKCDPGNLHRVVSNLLNNAVEAIGDIGTVVLSLEPKSKWIVLSIVDDGPGFRKDQLLSIFKSHNKTSKKGGYGLGLAHAKTCVENWKGTIVIRNNGLKGAVVEITLPIVSSPNLPRLAGGEADRPVVAVDNTKKEYVFIDDDAVITEAWKLRADLRNIKLYVFNKAQDFLNTISTYNKDTIFYVDHDLNDKMQGEDMAKILFDAGYRNIYLAIGHEWCNFSPVPWIKEIVGKDCPF